MKKTNTLIKASIIAATLLAGADALALNADANNNGVFETRNILPGISPISFDEVDPFAGGSDQFAFTTFGAGAQSQNRTIQVNGLSAGEDTLRVSWTHTSGAAVQALYSNFASGWEWDPQLDALINAPTSNEAFTPTVLINGVAVAADTAYILTGVSNGDVITIDSSYAGTENNLSSVIHGFIGTPITAVPVPAAAWLFGSALVGLAGVGRKRKIS